MANPAFNRTADISLAVQACCWLALIGALVYVAPFAIVLHAKSRAYCAV